MGSNLLVFAPRSAEMGGTWTKFRPLLRNLEQVPILLVPGAARRQPGGSEEAARSSQEQPGAARRQPAEMIGTWTKFHPLSRNLDQVPPTFTELGASSKQFVGICAKIGRNGGNLDQVPPTFTELGASSAHFYGTWPLQSLRPLRSLRSLPSPSSKNVDFDAIYATLAPARSPNQACHPRGLPHGPWGPRRSTWTPKVSQDGQRDSK
jgi:hypothetical protein